MKFLPVVLQGWGVRLEPLGDEHRSGLADAGCDPSAWAFSPPDQPGMTLAHWIQVWIDRALTAAASGQESPFAVRRLSDGRLVGSTRFMNIETAHKRVEIGSTWYEPAARGGFINPACKRLLLRHAFDVEGAVRVELKCDARNLVSRAAIRKLGAQEEGILRRHMILGDGYIRDTVYHSVLREEWPGVDARLAERLVAAG